MASLASAGHGLVSPSRQIQKVDLDFQVDLVKMSTRKRFWGVKDDTDYITHEVPIGLKYWTNNIANASEGMQKVFFDQC